MTETASQLDLLIADIRALGDINIELVVALVTCRTVLDEIYFNSQRDKEDHALWASDQRKAIAMADAVLAKVRAQ